jgi:hypothetical protein
MASAATVDVASADGESVAITGTTTITSLGTGFVGCYRELRFAGSLTLTHSANLSIGGSNYTTVAGDVMGFRCVAAGVWILVNASRPNDTSKAPLASPSFTGTVTYNGIEVGFRGVPLTTQNGAYTFVAADKGKGRAKTDANPYNYTVPASVFAAGDVITVRHSGSAGNITLVQGVGLTLGLAGTTTTGNRTIAPGGLATIFFDSATQATVSGAGVS